MSKDQSFSKKRNAEEELREAGFIDRRELTAENYNKCYGTTQGEDLVFMFQDNQFRVPLSTLKSLKTGEKVAAGIPNYFLRKTSYGGLLIWKVIKVNVIF